MKLSNLRIIGRYTNPETGRPVNVHKGRRMGYGTDHYFYLLRGRRVFIGDNEFSKWTRVFPAPITLNTMRFEPTKRAIRWKQPRGGMPLFSGSETRYQEIVLENLGQIEAYLNGRFNEDGNWERIAEKLMTAAEQRVQSPRQHSFSLRDAYVGFCNETGRSCLSR